MSRKAASRFLSYALPALVAMPAIAAAASHEPVAVSARVITSCRMGTAPRGVNVTVRCTGEVALQAGAATPGGGEAAALRVVQGVHRQIGSVNHTVLEAGPVGADFLEQGRIVTVLF